MGRPKKPKSKPVDSLYGATAGRHGKITNTGKPWFPPKDPATMKHPTEGGKIAYEAYKEISHLPNEAITEILQTDPLVTRRQTTPERRQDIWDTRLGDIENVEILSCFLGKSQLAELFGYSCHASFTNFLKRNPEIEDAFNKGKTRQHAQMGLMAYALAAQGYWPALQFILTRVHGWGNEKVEQERELGLKLIGNVVIQGVFPEQRTSENE